MSRGLGITQRGILRALAADTEYAALTVAELAGRLERSPRQIRAAVRALEHRGLVVVTRESIGWRGAGEYGRLARVWEYNPLPVAVTVRKGERLPYTRYRSVAWRDTDYGRNGMPTYGLYVWLPERRQRYGRHAVTVPSGDEVVDELTERYGPG